MRTIQDVSCLFAPAPASWPPQWATLRWLRAGANILFALLFLCLFLLLAACAKEPKLKPYDYDTHERAKVTLPKDSALELEGKSFLLKKKIEFPSF